MGSIEDQLKSLGFNTAASSSSSTTEHQQTAALQKLPVRIQRQVKGRKGKGVTVILDLEVNPTQLNEFARALRKKCGVGGAVKEGTIELQGDQRQSAKEWLEQKGFKAKLAGG